MKIIYHGTNVIAQQAPTWANNSYIQVTINVSIQGVMTVLVDGTNVFGNVQLPNYVPTTGRFGLFGRAGGSYEAHFVDDLSITLLNTPRNGQVGLVGGNVTYDAGTNTYGSDTFYYLVSDGQSGGTVWDTATVTIHPTNGVLPTMVSCATNRSISVGANCQFTLPDLRSEVVTAGNCVGGVSQSPLPGTLLGLGPNTVTFTVSDSEGNIGTCNATVTGIDTTAPLLTCPSPITVEATGPAGAAVTFSASASDSCDLNPTINYSSASGSTFPIGTNTVTVTAYDASLNTNTCSFTIIVRDTTAPLIVCPSDQVLTCNSTNGMVATYSVTANDVADPAPLIVVTPSSGSTFTLGTNIVSATATDASGNQSACTFKVIVLEPQLTLAISRSDTNVVITWPQSCLVHDLQHSSDISSPANWASSGAQLEVVGSLYRVTIPATNAARFYRLQKP